MPWFAAFFALHLAARGLAAWEEGFQFALQEAMLWLRGVGSDAVASLLLALLAALLARRALWAGWALLTFWAAALAGNVDYISEWQSNLPLADIAFFGNGDFLRGSVLTASLFIRTVSFITLAAVVFYATKQYLPPFRLRGPLLASALLVVAIPVSTPPVWIQKNLIEDNIDQFFYAQQAEPLPVIKTPVQASARLPHTTPPPPGIGKQDLDGERFVTARRGLNVMIVAIESLSEATVRRGWMPYLKKLADENLHYTQYINPNITTVRGMYAMLCGEQTYLGRFGKEFLVQHITSSKRQCLPALLNTAGYHTVYMQAANLGFQNKDKVMAAMDFSEVLGNSELKEGHRFSEWGLDDYSLFETAQRKIERLEKTYPGKPWFYTMLTVGTHHPYNVDPSFDPDYPLKERAFRYCDKALESLVAWLDKTGRRQNTLLIITSDESREVMRERKGIGRFLTRNQGLAVILSPEHIDKKIEQPYMQSDLTLSILDYASVHAPDYIDGRSMFRHYSSFRPLVFGDYSKQSVYAYRNPNELTHCETDKWICNRYRITVPNLFEEAESFTRPKLTEAYQIRRLFEKNTLYWLGQ